MEWVIGSEMPSVGSILRKVSVGVGRGSSSCIDMQGFLTVPLLRH